MKENSIIELIIPDNCSIDFVRETLEFYRQKHMIVQVVFRGKSIYSNSLTLEEDIYYAYYNVKGEEYRIIKKIENKITGLKEELKDLNEIKKDNIYRFFLNYARQFVREDIINEFIDDMITTYECKDGLPLLKDVTMILSIVDETNPSYMSIKGQRLKLFNFFQTKITKDDHPGLDIAISIALKYTKYPELLKKCLYFTSLNDVEQRIDDEIDDNYKLLSKIRKYQKKE